MTVTDVVVNSVVAAAVFGVTVAALRWEWREHQRIRAYRQRLAARVARIDEDVAWRHHLLHTDMFGTHTHEATVTDLVQERPLELAAGGRS